MDPETLSGGADFAELEQDFARAVRTGAKATPWILSSSAHLLALSALGALFYLTEERFATQPGVTRVAMEAHLLPADPGDDGDDQDAGDSAGKQADASSLSTTESLDSLAAAWGPLVPWHDPSPVKLKAVKPPLAREVAMRTPDDDDPPDGRGRGGSGSGLGHGRNAYTSIFGAGAEGQKFVYVFDRSGSMGELRGAPLAAAKAQLIASLKDLDDTHQFQIIFYNERPKAFTLGNTPGRLVFGNEQNRRAAEKFIGSITADGATRHVEALELALRMVPDAIFFLTDADEPQISREDLAHLRQRNRGTIINAIEFGKGEQTSPDNFLDRLARENGGQHVYIDVTKLRR